MWRLFEEPARRFGYKATYFHEMLEEHGALETARRLAGSPKHHEGLTKLYDLKALHLSVEALVLRPPYDTLFEPSLLKAARKKLRDLGYEESRAEPAPRPEPPEARATQQHASGVEAVGAPRFLIVPAKDDGQVEVWSTYRLQFDHKERTTELKRAIGAAAGNLKASRDQLLSAVYVSECREYVDAENVLLYNVGTANFARAAREGVRFERVFGCPPAAPSTLAGPAEHYHHYSLVRRGSTWRYWEAGPAAFTWKALAVPTLDAVSKPDAIWLAMRDAARAASPGRLSGKFGLLLELGAPATPAPRPADIVKPLVDGVVSGLHSHNGEDLSVLVERLAGRMGESPERISESLMSQTGAVLGERRLLWPRADGYQWNPADDELMACDLVWTEDSDATGWTLSGSIVPVGLR